MQKSLTKLVCSPGFPEGSHNRHEDTGIDICFNYLVIHQNLNKFKIQKMKVLIRINYGKRINTVTIYRVCKNPGLSYFYDTTSIVLDKTCLYYNHILGQCKCNLYVIMFFIE